MVDKGPVGLVGWSSTEELNTNREVLMATVIVQAVVSLDGFIARPDDTPGPIFDWYAAGTAPMTFRPGGHTFSVSPASRDHLVATTADVRCQVIGRHLFDIVDGWGGVPMVGDHVYVVSSREEPAEWRDRHPEAPYTFTAGIEEAVGQASERAGDGGVIVSAGDVGGQVVAAGLADELALDLAPVFLGSGKRFLGPLTDEIVLADPHLVVQGERVLHLRYRLR
jgi:dihydrofolate reductase